MKAKARTIRKDIISAAMAIVSLEPGHKRWTWSTEKLILAIALFVVSFSHSHYNVIQRVCKQFWAETTK